MTQCSETVLDVTIHYSVEQDSPTNNGCGLINNYGYSYSFSNTSANVLDVELGRLRHVDQWHWKIWFVAA